MKIKLDKKGFTLVELIIVIAIIAIISAVIFVSINPKKRIEDSRNAERHTEVDAILNAIKKYEADNGELPTGIDTTLKMLGTDESGCDVSCGSSGGDNSGGSQTIDHNYDEQFNYNPSDFALIDVDTGDNNLAQLTDQGGSYSFKKPYLDFSVADALDTPDTLDDIDVALGSGNEGSVEFSLRYNLTDYWHNGLSWIENNGLMQLGDSLWDDAVGVWHMDNDWTDAKNSYDGTPNGDSTFDGFSKLGTHAATFDGAGDYVSFGDQNDFSVNNTGSLSISFWFKADDISTRQILIAKGNTNTDSNPEWRVELTGNELHTNMMQSSNGGNIRREKITSGITTSQWHHIVIVFNGASSGSNIDMYLNGVESSVFDSSNSFTYQNTAGHLYFGRAYAGHVNYHFDGELDEVVIFNKALTDSEAKGLYADQDQDKHSNTEAEMDANLSSFTVSDGVIATIRAFFISNGTQKVELDDVNLNYSQAGGGGDDGEQTAEACLNISETLEDYIGSIPTDPALGSQNKTYYAVKKLSPIGIKVIACEVEQDALIEVSR